MNEKFNNEALERCQRTAEKLLGSKPISGASLASEGRTADLEKLHAILSARHAGLDDGHSLLEAVEWLLGISFEQTAPEPSPAERQVKVRQLLLVSPSLNEQTR
jgi:hypothetical protein